MGRKSVITRDALVAAACRKSVECWQFLQRTFWLLLLTTDTSWSPGVTPAGPSGSRRESVLPGVVERRLHAACDDRPSGPDACREREVVFLLHGICRSPLDMALLAGALRREGYEVVNWRYPSTRHSLDQLADRLARALEPYRDRKVNFVCHSMGGIVVRLYCARHKPQNVGRIVMVGTPNQGAYLADVLGDWLLYRVLFGPAGQQLRQGASGGCAGAGIPDCEFGVIAGGTGCDHGMNPIIPGDNDGTVSVESTRLEGMRDFLVLPYGHTSIPFMPRTVRNAIHFLKTGHFAETCERAAQAEPAGGAEQVDAAD